jgi:hypothetical protein
MLMMMTSSPPSSTSPSPPHPLHRLFRRGCWMVWVVVSLVAVAYVRQTRSLLISMRVINSGGGPSAGWSSSRTSKTSNETLLELLLSTSSCIWEPNTNTNTNTNTNNDDVHQPCLDILTQHMKVSLHQTRRDFLKAQQQRHDSTTRTTTPTTTRRRRYIHRRWLLLGDSTVFRLYTAGSSQSSSSSSLESYLMHHSMAQLQEQRRQWCYRRHLQCHMVRCSRCNTMEMLQLIPLLPTTTTTTTTVGWRLPNYTMAEGPMHYGYDHPYCTDCDGCDTRLLTCSLLEKEDDGDAAGTGTDTTSILEDTCPTDPNIEDRMYTGPAYGGYLSVEFARDVELQTEQYATTQENLLSNYIAQHWNTPHSMLQEFGRPICTVSTGLHDIALPNVTKAAYLHNVRWYLDILSEQCDYILWITNTCPLTNDYAQTQDSIYEWNMAVRDILLSSSSSSSSSSVSSFYHKSFYLDVFNASITFDHVDNIHMSDVWYQSLASFLQAVMEINVGLYNTTDEYNDDDEDENGQRQ